MTTFNIKSLVADLGGVAKIASTLNIPRSTPHRWLKSGRMSTNFICLILQNFPHVNINSYFEVTPHDKRKRARR